MTFKKISLSFDDIVSLLSNVNYYLPWVALLRADDRDWTKEEIEKEFKVSVDTSDACLEDKLAADLLSGEEIIVIDNYEDSDSEDAVHVLRLEDFEKASVVLANKYPEIMSHYLAGRSDVEDDNVFFQLAVFGEEIYE